MSLFTDVQDFHRVVMELDEPTSPTFPEDMLYGRVGHLREELVELVRGIDHKDMAEVADAIVDVIYVALGAAVAAGLPFDELWATVHRANMEKEGKPSDRYGGEMDAVKPDGWTPPEIDRVLEDAGYEKPDAVLLQQGLDLGVGVKVLDALGLTGNEEDDKADDTHGLTERDDERK